MGTADQMISCPICPRDTAFLKQNVLLSTSLLGSIASGFDKMLRAIDVQVTKAKNTRAKLVLTLGDRSSINAHRHTGAEDCPAMFTLELEPDEWSVLTKRIVTKEIFTGGAQQQTLEGLVDAAERRQDVWHRYETYREAVAHDHSQGHGGPGNHDCAIFKLTSEVRRQISRLAA